MRRGRNASRHRQPEAPAVAPSVLPPSIPHPPRRGAVCAALFRGGMRPIPPSLKRRQASRSGVSARGAGQIRWRQLIGFCRGWSAAPRLTPCARAISRACCVAGEGAAAEPARVQRGGVPPPARHTRGAPLHAIPSTLYPPRHTLHAIPEELSPCITARD